MVANTATNDCVITLTDKNGLVTTSAVRKLPTGYAGKEFLWNSGVAGFKLGGKTVYVDNMKCYTFDSDTMVTSITPSAGSSGVAVNTSDVVIDFDRPMDAATLTTTNIIVKKENVAISGYSIQVVNSQKCKVILPTPLSYLSNYSVDVTSGVKDMFGNADAGTGTYFTTKNVALVDDLVVDSTKVTKELGGVSTDITDTGLTNGFITTTVKITNNADGDRTTTLIGSLYKKDANGIYTFMDFTTADSTIVFGGSGELTIGFDVPAHTPGEYIIKAFIWNTFDGMQPRTSMMKFTNTGFVSE
jgi:hypothetical protein